MLRTGMYHVSRALDIDAEHRAEDKIDQDQTVLNDIICQLENTKSSVCKTQDENLQSIVQKLVLVTVLEQLGLEATQLATERNTLDEECRIRSEQFSSLQSETHQLLEVNEKLRLKVREGDHKEEVLTAEIGILQGKLLELQEAHGNLQKENSLMLEEKGSLSKKFLSLEEEKRILEEENWVVFGETISLSNLSLIFKDFITEKSVQLKELGQNLEELHNVNYALEEKVRTMEGKLGMVEMENFHLKDSLEKSENELNTVRSFADQLNHEIENGRDILSRKETELLEAGQKLSALRDEKAELHKTVEVVKSECDEVKVIREDQEKQILKLSEENDHQKKENGCLREVNRGLEAKLWKLCEEIEEAKVREETLNHDLQRGRDEVELWETQAAAFFSELQISNVREAFLKRRCMSLSKHISTVHEALFKEKDAKLVGHLHVERSQDCSENQIAMVPEGNSDLQDLQTRIKAIEKGLIEMERLALEEHLDTNAKLEAAMKQIEELKSQRSFRRENIQTSRHLNPQQEEEELGDGTCDDRKLHTKDIMLDQISECSSYGISRRETAEVDDQMLELWETTDPNGSIALTVAKAHKGATAPVGYHQVVAEGHKSEHPSSEIMVEKELGVDKLEISKRFVEPGQEGNKRKTLERLASDAQKLTNLQITVQDLKKKVQFTEDSRNVKGIEYDTVKGQLEEVEGAILKLCDSNSKLTKNIEDNSLSDGKPAMELEESRSVRRGRISEQARKGSEKIGRLQLEVQRIQFLLLKLDDEKESKAKTRISEPKRRVLLRDYLYGGRRTTHKRKKAHFCSCVQSPTTGD
ncbi:Protein NETWORKED 1D [Vitis vinifera]|uniref:Protein NETWORKED 1D n=1 Tax=Vitis vinifera TaxID=29760 RepID=A0A438KHN7_VITVI|nr:Protein NETWORKED 1D [Vitis vinifera]